MIAKYLEAMFRHKLLVFLPPILIPLIVAPIAFFTMAPSYQTWTGVWVDKPRYLASQDEMTNAYVTPAQYQSGRLSELLQTRSFLNAVAARTTLAPLTGNEKGEDRIREIITRGTQILPRGERLLVVGFKGDSPQLALQIANAMAEEFRDRTNAERVTQASFATSFVEARLKEAEDRQNQANEAVKKYVAANPRLTNIDPSRGAAGSSAARAGLPTAAIDPQLAELLNRADLEKKEVERARGTLEQARFDASAGVEANDMRFQIVDPARLPTAPTSERRKQMMFVVIGLVVGVGVSAVLTVVLVTSDRSVRHENDLESLGHVVGVIPALAATSKKLTLSSPVARLSVGIPAGVALPSGMEVRS